MADSDCDPTWQPYWMGKKETKKKRNEVRFPIILRIRRFSKANGKSSWKIVSKTRYLKASSKESLNSFGYYSDTFTNSPMKSLTCPIDAKLIASIRDPNIDISPFEVKNILSKSRF